MTDEKAGPAAIGPGREGKGPMTATFIPGQTVRWSQNLRNDWHEGRAADGASPVNDAQVGRVAKRLDEGYCGTCDQLDQDCPGPWYAVDFGDENSGFGGSYAEHELEPA